MQFLLNLALTNSTSNEFVMKYIQFAIVVKISVND